MTTTLSPVLAHAGSLVAQVCPQAPPGAQVHVDNILGYVLWGVGILFFLGVVIAVAAIAGGRMFGMPHASTGGIIGLVIVFVAVIAYPGDNGRASSARSRVHE